MIRTGKLKKSWVVPDSGILRLENKMPEMTPDEAALALLRSLARRFCAVEVTFADCGCHTVTLFADGKKIIEEDKNLLTAAMNAAKLAGNTTEIKGE